MAEPTPSASAERILAASADSEHVVAPDLVFTGASGYQATFTCSGGSNVASLSLNWYVTNDRDDEHYGAGDKKLATTACTDGPITVTTREIPGTYRFWLGASSAGSQTSDASNDVFPTLPGAALPIGTPLSSISHLNVDIDTPLTATISFDYAITDGVDETSLFVQIPTDGGAPLKSWDVHFTKDGHFSETVSLPAGTYPLTIEGSRECGVDCSDVRTFYEGLFTVISVPYGDTFTMLTSDPVQTVSDDGDVTLSFGYDLRPGVDRDGASAVVAAYVANAAGERIWFSSGGEEWLPIEGPGVFTDTLRLAPGTYTRHIASSYILHCDCGDVKDITEPYTFTVPEQVDPTPTPTPTVTPTTTPTSTPTPQPTGTASPSPSATAAKVSLSTSTVSRGSQVTVTAGGFAAGESVEIWLHSTPVKLLSTTASADGTVSATVTVPSGTDIGAHKIEVRGSASGSVYASLTVIDGLAVTGFDTTTTTVAGLGATVLLLGGIGFVLMARRRAKTGS